MLKFCSQNKKFQNYCILILQHFQIHLFFLFLVPLIYFSVNLDICIFIDKYIEYYDNGIIYLHGNYSFGKKSGNWLEYYPNRILKSEGNYIDDDEVDKWHYYNDEGELI